MIRARWTERHTFAAVALAYALATILGRATVLPGEHVSLAWPAAGIGVLWLMYSAQWGAALTVQAVELALVLLATGATPLLAVSGTLAMTIQSALVVILIRRWIPEALGAGGTQSIHSLPVLARGTMTVAIGCLVGAAIGTTGLWLETGAVTWRDGLLWFGQQFGSIMLVGSVGHLTWERLVQPHAARRPASSRSELALLWLASGLVYGVVFLLPLPLAYAAIPLSIWCGVRFSTYAAAVHAGTFGGVALALTLAGRGPFSLIQDPATAALLTQAFVLVALFTALVVGTVCDQREDVLARLTSSEATAAARARLLAAMTEAMTEGLVVVDATGQVVTINGAARRLLERTSMHGSGNTAAYQLLRADGSPLPRDEHPSRRALAEGDVAPHDVVVPLENGRQRVVSVRATSLPEGTESADGRAALVVYRDVTSERAEARRLAEFAEVTAHELRSPLTTVRGWVSLASQELSGDVPSVAQARDLLGKALTGVVRLGDLLDGMLDQALAEGGELDLEPLEMAGPAGLIADLGELLAVPDITVRGPEGAIVLGDEWSVRQLFANLLGNSVKYVSPDRPLRVDVDLEVRGRRVLVGVTDNGRGIPEGEHESVFDRFSRADSAGSTVGTGIGLSICRLVVERHGGTIRSSVGQGGVGTTFTFDLPAYLPAPAGVSAG
ncbi:ATP-binding protein [Nocardioides zhouii]|uniref:ATP-binding protein n=1 Tax=Nocardioides zhouii TaxID=1168729 RepID=UPI0013EC15ED|nr:ATP-binding protein [Nocardioides zhouii]